VKGMSEVSVLVLLLSIPVAGCVTGPAAPLAADSARPRVDQDGFVRNTESITVHVPMEFLHHWSSASSGRLENTLRGTNKIAGVAHTEMIRGTWPQPGARRRVLRKDGNQSLEEVLENTWPTSFRYEVWGFTDKERILTDYLVGKFQNSEAPDGTLVNWTYSFHRRSMLATPLLSMMVRGRVPEFMRTALANMKEQAEEAYKNQAPQPGPSSTATAHR
jgi:hypothetical protein